MSEIAGQASTEDQTSLVGKAEGAVGDVAPTTNAPPPPPHIARLIEWHRQRNHAIRAQSALDRTCDQYVARYLGYHAGLPMGERVALMREAALARKRIEKQARKSRGQKGREPPPWVAPEATDGEGLPGFADQPRAALAVCSPVVVATMVSRAPWDAIRAEAEGQMRAAARLLPVWPHCQGIVGFGELGLAALVAEAGNDLAAYPHYYHLWKRLGLAPYKGRAMSSWRAAELSKDEWTEAGYSPPRRGRIAGDIQTPLFFRKRHNAYGKVYTARRERTALTHPEWTKRHSDNDARRIMVKALVKDIWRWWRAAGATLDLLPGSGMPLPLLREAA